MVQARTLSSALMEFQSASAADQNPICRQTGRRWRATVSEIKQRLDALETAQGQPPSLFHNQRTGESV